MPNTRSLSWQERIKVHRCPQGSHAHYQCYLQQNCMQNMKSIENKALGACTKAAKRERKPSRQPHGHKVQCCSAGLLQVLTGTRVEEPQSKILRMESSFGSLFSPEDPGCLALQPAASASNPCQKNTMLARHATAFLKKTPAAPKTLPVSTSKVEPRTPATGRAGDCGHVSAASNEKAIRVCNGIIHIGHHANSTQLEDFVKGFIGRYLGFRNHAGHISTTSRHSSYLVRGGMTLLCITQTICCS